MKAKIGFVSLGCPKNQVDTELMLARVVQAGYTLVEEDIDADLMIVNTCAFIRSAKEEGIETILDLVWLKKNRSLKGIIVTGCMAQRYMEEIRQSLPEVDAVLSLGNEKEIVPVIEKVLAGEKAFCHGAPEELLIEGDRVVTNEFSAYLRIAEGCDNRCSYCAIPMIRGAFRSRKMEDILAEAKTLAGMGIREINIIAQDTSRYGLDLYGKYALATLCDQLASEEFGFAWIRLMYCYPDKITDELIEVMAKHPNICRYIDLPVQHISDPVLQRMNRHGGSEIIRSAIARLRAGVPGITIRTTVMVGFPGEGAKDFSLLAQFVKEAKFEHLGAFAYSREENTPAYSMDKQVTKKTKEARLNSVMESQYRVMDEWNRSFLGKTITVLCEGYDPIAERYFGRSEFQAPEIDGAVYFSAPRGIKNGEFVSVLIEDVLDYDLIGKKVRR